MPLLLMESDGVYDIEGRNLCPPHLEGLNWLPDAPMWQLLYVYVSANLTIWSGWKQPSPSDART